MWLFEQRCHADFRTENADKQERNLKSVLDLYLIVEVEYIDL